MFKLENLTEVNNPPAGVSISVTNEEPSSGGTDGQTVEEIRNNVVLSLHSQLRCVTKEDYVSRILSLPPKFGSIAKCYVERLDGGGLLVSTFLTIKKDNLYKHHNLLYKT